MTFQIPVGRSNHVAGRLVVSEVIYLVLICVTCVLPYREAQKILFLSISTWERFFIIYTLSKSPIHLSLFDLLFSNYVVVYLSTYLCCSFLKLFNCHWVMDRVERSNSSLLLREKFRLLLPKVDRCMYADHENVLALKTAWEVDGDRTIANIRQLNEN